MDEVSSIAARLEDAFNCVWRERMRDLPILNPALSVEAVGACWRRDRWLAGLITPWSINLVLALGPTAGGEGAARIGERRLHDFPAGQFEFVGGSEEGLGCFEMCSLFSPALQFASQDVARAAALGALQELLTPCDATEGAVGAPQVGKTGAASASHKKTSAKLSRRDLLRGAFGREGNDAA